MPVDLFEAAGVQPQAQAPVDLFQAAGIAPPKPSLGQRFEAATAPSAEYTNQSTWQKLVDLPKATGETFLSMASSYPALLAKLGTRAVTAPFVGTDKAEQYANTAQQMLQFQPDTPMGQQAVKLAGSPIDVGMQYVKENLGYPGQVAAETVMGALPMKGMQKPIQVGKTLGEKPSLSSRGGLQADQVSEAQQLAQQQGLNLSPRAFKESRITRAEEAISNLPIVKEYTNRLRRDTNDLLVGQIDEAGSKLATKEGVREFKAKKDALYQDAINTLEENTSELPKTSSFMGDIMKQEGLKDSVKAEVMDIMNRAKEAGGFTKEMVNEITANRKLGPFRDKLKDSILEDMKGIPGGMEAVEAIKSADVNYRFASKSTQFNNFLNKVIVGVGNQRIINPVAWRQSYEGIRNNLAKFHPDLMEKLDAIDKQVRLAGDDLGAYMKWEQGKANGVSNLVSKLMMGGLGTAAYFHPGAMAAGAATIPVGMAITRSSMKPGGMLRPKPSLKLGGQ